MNVLGSGTAVKEPAEGESPAVPHYPSLDGARGAAALMVVVFHALALLQSGETSDPLNRFVTQWIYGFGYIGVAVFFLLSGFLLFSEFAMDLVARTGRKSMSRFASRRFLRIYPAYWAALIAAELLLGPLIGSRFGLFSLMERYVDSSHVFVGLGVAWSLTVEVTFYLFLALFVLVLGIFCRRIGNQNLRVVLVVLLTFSLLAVPRLFQYFVKDGSPTDYRIHRSLFDYLDWFGWGMLLSIFASLLRIGWRPMSLAYRFGTMRRTCWPLAVIVYGAATLIIDYDGSKIGAEPPVPDALLAHGLYGVAALLFLIPLTIGTGAKSKRGFFSSRPMYQIGLVSYGVYLWHDIFLKYYLWNFTYTPGIGLFVLAVALLVPLSLAVGWLSYRLIERPVMKLSW
jgi:peptidoglycan/LPS O-acetylase OafA/YrhL